MPLIEFSKTINRLSIRTNYGGGLSVDMDTPDPVRPHREIHLYNEAEVRDLRYMLDAYLSALERAK